MQSDGSLDVRAAAAQGLARFAELIAHGRLSDRVATGLLNDLIAIAKNDNTPSLVRRRSLESAAVFGALPEIVELIRSAYRSDDDSTRAGAVYAMGRTLDRRWLNILLAELESPDAELRYEAARACGEIGDASAVTGLERCGQDRDAEVRQAAIAALGRIGSSGAMRSLHRLVESARPVDREAIAEALNEATSDDDL
ncbi:MAG: HEAT repeat domain-containing protein [Thermomicrobiales bacterium]